MSADLGVCGGGRANTKGCCAVDVFPLASEDKSIFLHVDDCTTGRREKWEWSWALAIISSGADFEALAFLDFGFLNVKHGY